MVTLDTFGENQRRAAEGNVVNSRLDEIFNDRLELLPGRFNFTRFAGIAYEQIRGNKRHAAGRRSVELVRKDFGTRRR